MEKSRFDDSQKEKIVSRYLIGGEKVKDLSNEFDVSSSTIYNWAKSEIGAKIASEKIKRLIKYREFEKACKLGKKFPDNEAIQLQIVTILIYDGQYDEAKKVCETFPDSLEIQTKMISILMKKKKNDEIKEIGKRFPNTGIIQAMMAKLYMEEGNYDEVKEIGRRFPTFESIQSKVVRILMGEGKEEEAQIIANNFRDNSVVQKEIDNYKKKNASLEGKDNKASIDSEGKEESLDTKDNSPESENDKKSNPDINRIVTLIYAGEELPTIKSEIERLESENKITHFEAIAARMGANKKYKLEKNNKTLLKSEKGKLTQEEYSRLIKLNDDFQNHRMFDISLLTGALSGRIDMNLLNEIQLRQALESERERVQADLARTEAEIERRNRLSKTNNTGESKTKKRPSQFTFRSPIAEDYPDGTSVNERKKNPDKKDVVKVKSVSKKLGYDSRVIQEILTKMDDTGKSLYLRMSIPNLREGAIKLYDKLDALRERTKEAVEYLNKNGELDPDKKKEYEDYLNNLIRRYSEKTREISGR